MHKVGHRFLPGREAATFRRFPDHGYLGLALIAVAWPASWLKLDFIGEYAFFGPFLVECDVQGNSLYQMAMKETNEKLKGLYEGLPLPTLKRMGEMHNPEDEVF